MLSLLLRSLREVVLWVKEERLARSMIGRAKWLGNDDMLKACLPFVFWCEMWRRMYRVKVSSRRKWQMIEG